MFVSGMNLASSQGQRGSLGRGFLPKLQGLLSNPTHTVETLSLLLSVSCKGPFLIWCQLTLIAIIGEAETWSYILQDKSSGVCKVSDSLANQDF